MAAQPRITLPHKIVQLFDKVKYKKDLKSIKDKRYANAPVLIACKRKKFNHHVGQTYNNFSPLMLASGAWKHRKSTGDYFTILPRGKNPSLNSSILSFTEFGLNSKIISALEAIQISNPTNIQSLTIPSLMSGKSVLCTAETGSGKTLAYLLPIFEQILMKRKLERREGKEEGGVMKDGGGLERVNAPQAIIILPSRELAQQVYDVCERVGELTQICADLKCGGMGTQKILRKMAVKKMEVLVTTPGILIKLLTNKLYDLGQLGWMVFDEADTLLDDSFEQIIFRIINKLKFTHESMVGKQMQLCLVAATMPTSLRTKLSQIIPIDEMEVLQTQSLHRLLPHITQKFIRMSSMHTPEHLVHLLKSLKAGTVVIIFCNKPDTVRFLGHTLTANSIPSITLHADMPYQVRVGRFEKFNNGSSDILVCTDIASRGLDTVHADYVINFEFPDFMSDYVHRVGRVGRVGSPPHCHALSYVTKPWQVELLWQIEISARKNVVLHNVNANIKRKLNFIKTDQSRDATESTSPKATNHETPQSRQH